MIPLVSSPLRPPTFLGSPTLKEDTLVGELIANILLNESPDGQWYRGISLFVFFFLVLLLFSFSCFTGRWWSGVSPRPVLLHVHKSLSPETSAAFELKALLRSWNEMRALSSHPRAAEFIVPFLGGQLQPLTTTVFDRVDAMLTAACFQQQSPLQQLVICLSIARCVSGLHLTLSFVHRNLNVQSFFLVDGQVRVLCYREPESRKKVMNDDPLLLLGKS
jgi:hypothetical protein